MLALGATSVGSLFLAAIPEARLRAVLTLGDGMNSLMRPQSLSRFASAGTEKI